MEAKEFLRNMCTLVFGEMSMVVKNGKLVKSTTISKFFSDEKRKKPTKKICEELTNKLEYFFYLKGKNAEEREKNIIRFSIKVIFWLMIETERDISFFKVTDENGNLVLEKRDKLYNNLSLIINQLYCDCEINKDTLNKVIDIILGYYRADFAGQMPPKLTAEEYNEYEDMTVKSIERLSITFYSHNRVLSEYGCYFQEDLERVLEQKYKKLNSDFSVLISFLENLLEVNRLSDMKKENLEMVDCLNEKYIYDDREVSSLNWKYDKFERVTKGKIDIANVYQYFDFFKDLLKCNKWEDISETSYKFYCRYQMDEIDDKFNNWKAHLFYKFKKYFFQYEIERNITIAYVDYFNYNKNYYIGIKKMKDYFERLNEIFKIYCDNSIVDAIIKSYSFRQGVPVNEYDANSWLFVDNEIRYLYELVSKIIGYLSFRASVYDRYCIR